MLPKLSYFTPIALDTLFTSYQLLLVVLTSELLALYFHSVHVSSHGGLEVERWSDNRLYSASVDEIPLGDIYMVF